MAGFAPSTREERLIRSRCWTTGLWLALAMAWLAWNPACQAQAALSITAETCLFHFGDNPAWAAPDLDDRTWLPTAQLPEKQHFEPRVWFRCRLTPASLAPTVNPVLQVDLDSAYQLFLDGQLLGTFGNLVTGSHTVGIATQYSNPRFADRTKPFLLALRLTETPTIYSAQPTFDVTLGDATYLADSRSAAIDQAVRSRWIIWLGFALIGLAGLFFLTLYQFDRSQTAILWVGIAWATVALIRLDDFLLAASIPIPSRLVLLLYAIGNFNGVFAPLFSFALVGRRVPWFYRIPIFLNAMITFGVLLAALLPNQISFALRWYCDSSPTLLSTQIPVFVLTSTALITAFWPLQTIARRMMPIYIACFFWGMMEIMYLGIQFPPLGMDPFIFLRLQAPRAIAITTVVIVMTLLLMARIRNNNQEKAALAGEMAAAREMQRLLVPEVQGVASGLAIEAVFLPAKEVGGDFYRCRVLPDGSQWILIGDVSGKGAAAAIAGAMLLGASEGHEEDSPTVLLAQLNRAFCRSGIGGFATCQVARIRPDGRVQIANAGHLSPYVDGHEVTVAGGLPVGITEAEQYEVTELQLEPGQTITLLSDGVVEARNAGGELFGFARTAEAAKGSARELAEVAQRFGQEDDITVLTVALAG